jgi:BASS family bile acid:Na+ symporter
MVILAGSSAIAAPLLLCLLLPLMSGSQPLEVDAAKIAVTLLAMQLAPLCLGLGVRHWLPGTANRLLRPANLLSAVLNLATMGLVLVVYFPLMAEIRLRGYLGMAVLLAASCVAGWLLGGSGRDNRKALMLTTSLRNVGVALVIATGNFGGTAAVTAVLAYGIFEIVCSLLLAVACGRVKLRNT